MTYTILQGDNRLTLKTLEDNSVDAIITDPPYGIDFLGKEWDANTGALQTYQECLRVLKPGGHILAFSAARTYHHLAVTLEQAGFEIRDQLMWLYASGFPKSKKHLKPAHEPICLAKKSGKGVFNIEECRINSRYPSNVLGEVEGYQKYFYCPKVSRKERHIGFDTSKIPTNPNGILDNKDENGNQVLAIDSKRLGMEPGNNHPTVKPVELMKYLIKLVTPPNSTVLDPFTGSGSTGMAAVELGHTFIGCELDPNYVNIATTRIAAYTDTGLSKELFE